MSVLSTASHVCLADSSPCTACGACCAYSAEWPRFTCEDDAAIDRLPLNLINASQSGMKCEGARCAALIGTVGVATSCMVYSDRPDVCRECQPGDDACRMAREFHGLPTIADTE